MNKLIFKNTFDFLRWIFLSIITGLLVGGVGSCFVKGLSYANDFRTGHPQIIFALPLAGLIIVFLYKICKNENDGGTNLVISALHAKSHIPFRMAPLIFISTIMTHLFGGSAGREGAALQLGGSIGNQLGRFFHLEESDRRMLTMCGMSAAFSSIFGTPLAAVIFVMEISSVGMMQYAAFVPCMFASLTASSVATLMGVHAESFTITGDITFALVPALHIIILGTLCALLSMLLCQALHFSGDILKKYLKNPYLRILVASAVIIILTVILKTDTYSGAGIHLIEEAFLGESPNMAFLWKIIFTALTLGAGFKGGEIVPSFCIGATFGCLYGNLVGISPSLCAAVAMISVFCGVTNCPIASLIIGFELFGLDALKYLLIGVSLSYVLSGYGGLYSEQTILYSKFKIDLVKNKS